ncbi:restriction endonuclease PLD domain-containing protein [Arthrobacter sp. ISL-5]|uniref:restriction endonuclease PLD domain-containing protein n=1 Tax=Arthrobacter sp. ISL-5 TaxID=2819111 RepID=UPI001BE6AA06|nr:restriction endonuclease PLD domain-containing protein [Arthrobacter sp. ISL-5]MBT2556076.1 NgoFVII family restriction endonuclease [Arthrobacter sp. ISL-5]
MERLDVAVGYFDLRGWRTFQEIVDAKSEQHTKPVTRILVGMVLAGADRQLLDALQADMAPAAVNTEVNNSKAKARRDEVIRSLREQLVRGIPKATDRETLQALKRQLDSGAVEIKVHTRRPLHGKTYIFHRQDNTNPVTGYVGSSDLTSAGLNRNYE